VEVLEQSVDTLKSTLRSAEQRNRQLKLAIDELQSHHSDSQHGGPLMIATGTNFVVPAAVTNVTQSPAVIISSAPVVSSTPNVNWGEFLTPPASALTGSRTVSNRGPARVFGKIDDKLQVRNSCCVLA
jgi:hypothetical protein